MSDWAVGDLAVCVDDSQRATIETGSLTPDEMAAGLRFLVMGRHYSIVSIVMHWSGKQAVYLAGQPVPAPYCAHRFAKIRPDEQEACEEEFVTLLKRSKQRVSA